MSYTKDVYTMFHSKPAPRGLIADLVELHGDAGRYFVIRLYRDNFDALPEATRVAATEWALETARNLNTVVPCDIQAWEKPPEAK